MSQKLEAALTAELPKHQTLQAYTLSPAIIAILVQLAQAAMSRLVSRCSDETPLSRISDALTSDDPRRQAKMEVAIRQSVRKELRDEKYDSLRAADVEWYGSIPKIEFASIRKVACDCDESDRDSFIDDSIEDKEIDYSF